jgi:uncharacterized membrane protein
MNMQPTSGEGPDRPLERNLGILTYGLYAGAVLFPVLAAAAVIVNYVKREEVRGTLLERHFEWQIRTFWFSLLWLVLGGALWLVMIGWLVLAAGSIWYLYRIIKGWLRFSEGKPPV